MITRGEKAQAIGMLRGGASVNEVAGELDLPLSLVEEWYRAENISVIDNIQAATTAMARLSGSSDEDAPERIKAGLERVAEQIITQLEFVTADGSDIQKAQVLRLCSESALKLYAAFVAPNITPTNPMNQLSNSSLLTFQNMMKD